MACSMIKKGLLGATLPERPRRTQILRQILIHEPVTAAGYRQTFSERDLRSVPPCPPLRPPVCDSPRSAL